MTTLKLPSNLVSDLKGIPLIDIRTRLPVNQHYTWAQLAGSRNPLALNTIVCHHDAIPKYKTIKYADIELASRIAQDHINSKKNHPNGDAGFPYDIWIRNGIPYWCNDIEQREYSVASNNGYTVNVCVSGDYHNFDELSIQDSNALNLSILMLMETFPTLITIKGHGEIVPTNCPGYSVKTVKENIASLKEQISYVVTPSAERVLAYAFADRMTDLGNKLADPKHGAEANRKIMLLEPVLTQMGYSGEVTAFRIVERVLEIYNNSKIAKYEDGGFKKLIIGANKAKELGLI